MTGWPGPTARPKPMSSLPATSVTSATCRPARSPGCAATRASAGCVLLGDPGRNYFSAQGLEERARYDIPTSLQLENRGMRETVVWRVLPHS